MDWKDLVKASDVETVEERTARREEQSGVFRSGSELPLRSKEVEDP